MRPRSKEILLRIVPLIISIYSVLMLMLNISSPILVASAIVSVIIIVFSPIFKESKITIKENFKEIRKKLEDATSSYQANNNILERLEKMINDLDMYKRYYRRIFLFFAFGYFSVAVLFALFINAKYITSTALPIGIITSISMTILSSILIFWNTIKLQNMEKIIDEVIIKEKDNLIELIERYYKPNFNFKFLRVNK